MFTSPFFTLTDNCGLLDEDKVAIKEIMKLNQTFHENNKITQNDIIDSIESYILFYHVLFEFIIYLFYFENVYHE